MTEKKFLSKNDIELLTEDIIKVVEAHLVDAFELISKGEKTRNYRYMCPSCNKNKGRFRVSTQDYRCEECKKVFKI